VIRLANESSDVFSGEITTPCRDKFLAGAALFFRYSRRLGAVVVWAVLPVGGKVGSSVTVNVKVDISVGASVRIVDMGVSVGTVVIGVLVGIVGEGVSLGVTVGVLVIAGDNVNVALGGIGVGMLTFTLMLLIIALITVNVPPHIVAIIRNIPAITPATIVAFILSEDLLYFSIIISANRRCIHSPKHTLF
jgi:hypothetical protein